MNEQDEIRLRQMLDAARLALNLVKDETRQSLDSDIKLALALERLIEIIGESASRVSEEGRQLLVELPWTQIVGMRNKLVHGYFDVNQERVWKTVMEDLPLLISLLEKVIP